jgi:hypothetical protein
MLAEIQQHTEEIANELDRLPDIDSKLDQIEQHTGR